MGNELTLSESVDYHMKVIDGQISGIGKIPNSVVHCRMEYLGEYAYIGGPDVKTAKLVS